MIPRKNLHKVGLVKAFTKPEQNLTSRRIITIEKASGGEPKKEKIYTTSRR